MLDHKAQPRHPLCEALISGVMSNPDSRHGEGGAYHLLWTCSGWWGSLTWLPRGSDLQAKTQRINDVRALNKGQPGVNAAGKQKGAGLMDQRRDWVLASSLGNRAVKDSKQKGTHSNLNRTCCPPHLLSQTWRSPTGLLQCVGVYQSCHPPG